MNERYEALLRAALRAPSAHNAQPWKLIQISDSTYEVHYIQHDRLPFDRDGKDAYLTMGAFLETLVLAAPNFGLSTDLVEILEQTGCDIHVANFRIKSGASSEDPLSSVVAVRATNRSPYDASAPADSLVADLLMLGNTIVDTSELRVAVTEASIRSWMDRRYLTDLKEWFRADNFAADGITPYPFYISRLDVLALRLAFRLGVVKPRRLAYLYSMRDVRVFLSGPSAAVISVPEKSPAALLDAGRRLLRSWLVVTLAGYSYQPCSILVDDPGAAREAASIAGVIHPVALYRFGTAKAPPRPSNRRQLSDVLVRQA